MKIDPSIPLRSAARFTVTALAGVLAIAIITDVHRLSAQQSPSNAERGAQAAPASPRAGRPPDFPTRPKAPQEVLDRGKANFSVNCAFCHGSDAAGGSVGPNLLRSQVVLEDQNGELIQPIVHGARADKGMPRIDITDAQISDIAAWLHSLKVGGKIASTEKINIVVGSADAGKEAFNRLCSSCHSVTGDLKGFAAKFSDPRTMQQTWIMPSGAGRGRPASPAVDLNLKPVTATVILASGAKVTGTLEDIDDFYVAVKTDDGVEHRFLRSNDVPRVEIHDPLARHRELLRSYKDKDIHDITAYLQSLK